MNASRKPPIWMVSGLRGAGKSAFCRGIAQSAHHAGWDVAGLLSPAQIEAGVKTGILAEDLRTGVVHRLASTFRQSQDDLAFGDWYFDRQTLEWGNRVLENSLLCDLLIVDELGPLELAHQFGWRAALEILPRAGYRLALVVIRPELQAIARRVFDRMGCIRFSTIVEIDQTHTTEQWVHNYWPKMMEINACR
ncbi:MAG: nucleoside-triphosphatase [Anaerolineales bacterium]|nr:nucleoside-triphosphatase [Anaerolineales bacterium]